jgi:hypothetical protein
MALGSKVRAEGLKLGMKAMAALMDNPGRAQKVVDAVAAVQENREVLDGAAARLLNLADLPSREDFKAMGKRVGKLKRDVRRLQGQVESMLEKLE